MDIQTVLSALGLLGIGGIIGGYLQNFWQTKSKRDLKIENLNENKYRSILIFMRCVLTPENLYQFQIEDKRIYTFNNADEIRKYSYEKLIESYYNSILYASDDVLLKIKHFIEFPSEQSFIEAATSMRKDLWKKSTRIGAESISLARNLPISNQKLQPTKIDNRK